MTILEALQWGENQLKEVASEKSLPIHNAKLDAQALLSACLQKNIAFMFSHMNDPLSPQVFHHYKIAIIRRKQHEPVAYITGEKEFYKRIFHVTPDVLIPRPETEQFIDLLKDRYHDGDEIIEIGTGSGAIAITAALELGTTVFASDISHSALSIAQKNTKHLDAQHLVTFHHGNLLEPYTKTRTPRKQQTFILANLPYIPLRQWEQVDPDVRQFEPKTALVSGIDGLDHYDQLLQQISANKQAFPSNLTLLFEIDPSQEETLPRLAEQLFPSVQTIIHKDLQNLSRIVELNINSQE